MRSRFIVLFALVMVGCSSKVPVSVQTTAGGVTTKMVPITRLSDADALLTLRDNAHRQGLSWRIFCNSTSEDDEFIAIARHKEEPANVTYLEEGALPEWVTSSPTQRGAIDALLVSIQQPENYYPRHRPVDRPLKRKVCPPELRGN